MEYRNNGKWVANEIKQAEDKGISVSMHDIYKIYKTVDYRVFENYARDCIWHGDLSCLEGKVNI